MRWEAASIAWTPTGQELRVPLRLERRALVLLGESAIWRRPPLDGARHEIRDGQLEITAPSLLDMIDPRELRRVLDEAVRRAHDEARATRARETVRADAFLAALREQPDR